jgi:uncharacterized protein (DUF934 family)
MTHDLEFLEFATAVEATWYAAANRPVAIQLDGKNLVIRRQDADRLEAAGVEFAYLSDGRGYERRIITVPVR